MDYKQDAREMDSQIFGIEEYSDDIETLYERSGSTLCAYLKN